MSKGMCYDCGVLVDTEMEDYNTERTFSEYAPGVHAEMSAEDDVYFCRVCAEDALYIQD